MEANERVEVRRASPWDTWATVFVVEESSAGSDAMHTGKSDAGGGSSLLGGKGMHTWKREGRIYRSGTKQNAN